MAGKKSFEEGKALDQALVAFWHSGYEGTSFADLEAATGLKKSSLYNAFGDKAEIYRRSLDRFEETYEAALLEGLEKPGLRSVLEAYFQALFEHFADSDVPCGSLATMRALASGRYDEDGGGFVKQQLDRLLKLLKQRFDRAVSDGELPKNTDTDAMASLFFVLSRGLAVLHSDERELAVLRQALEAAMTMIDSPPLKRRA